MSNKIINLLGLTAKDQDGITEATSPFKTVAGFMTDIVEATKDNDFVSSLISSTPWWVQVVGETLAETAPIIKFAVTLIGKLGEIRDPDKLAYLAFTLAYQRSMEKAFIYVGIPAKSNTQSKWQPTKDISLPEEGFSFGNYSIKDPLNHQFIKEADLIISEASKFIGYDENKIRIVIGEIHMRFPSSLKNILTHPQTREKFASLSDALIFDNTEERILAAWKDHFEYQRFLFEDKPVFGEENFSLSDIYVETECGVIECGDLNDNPQVIINQRDSIGDANILRSDPFDERCGGRFSLIDSVLKLIGDKEFKDAIIVQGPAGSGKSAFTLRLSVELLRQGLYPVRIRFRDLMLQFINIEDALPEAVRFWDMEDRSGELPKARPNELFLDFSIFDQSVKFGDATICPWVLILDGWDEVSIAAQKGFAVRVNEILTQVYDRFITRGNRPPVRVILTGRPSDAVMSSSFIKRQTKLLTIKPLRPDLLKKYIEILAYYLTVSSTPGDNDTDRFGPVILNYKKTFDELIANKHTTIIGENYGNMEIFGLPLLTHLAVRLIVNWPKDDIKNIIMNPTNLYRLLTDLTCGKGGRYGKDTFETQMTGEDIRSLLHETATAMTVYGRDNIPYDELDLRLSQLNEELIDRVQSVTKDHPITSLMINFFFKGGQKQLGAEFLHKSFREFLYAEAIVESLKEYGRKAPLNLKERDDNYYWKDFDPTDIRYDFSRRLGKLLSPQWISKEVSAFLEGLLSWELARTHEIINESISGFSTKSLTIEEWGKVRDGLADIWSWWGEGVHLRPQPVLQGKKICSWNKSVVEDFIFWSMNQNEEKGIIPTAARTTAMDSHLGNGLFQLNVLVHHYVALKDRSNNNWILPRDLQINNNELSKRQYQSFGIKDGEIKIRFRPTGSEPEYFRNYMHRINSAGWHPGTIFPSSLSLPSVDFDSTSLILTGFGSCKLNGSSFRNSNMIGSIFMDSDLSNVDFTGASLRLVDFTRSNIQTTKFSDHITKKYMRVRSKLSIHISDEFYD